MADFGLYGYQEEVVQRALKGENIIVWLPTGGGKTRAAVYVAKRHLETTANAKVAVLVNKVHLVDQHYSKEFNPHLGRDYRLASISGECSQKDFFGSVVQSYDLVICTAQILENSLSNAEEGKHTDLSDFTLLIFDECHHTHKEGVYNRIMRRYVERRLRGDGGLPQVLGLTASPGTGGAKSLAGAVEHVLQICANLDSVIVSSKTYAPELKKTVPRPRKRFDIVDPRPEDPLGDHLKWMMTFIHDFMALGPDFPLREIGSQEYEADVVILEKKGVAEGNRQLAQCALHLRQYNDALLIHDTVRMVDALGILEAFYGARGPAAIDGTDHFLLGLFQENEAELRSLSRDARYENPKMATLQRTLLEQFGSAGSRGILFCKTRKSTHCLHDWVLNDPGLRCAGVKAAILTGAGNGTNYMTQNEQKDTIRKFRDGSINLLISTSVAEEGLDIPECNLVVRYGLLTNEIAQQQASGRARASDSVYSVVAVAGGREVRREKMNDHLEELTRHAIAAVQAMPDREFRQKVTQLQTEAMLTRRLAEQLKIRKRSRFGAAEVQLLCRDCFKPVAFGHDIRLIEDTHYVNVNPGFERHYKAGGQVYMERTFEDWEPGRVISCAACSKKWGMEIKYKKVVLLPNIAIENFALETPEGRITVKKWKDVEFTVEKFDFNKYYEERSFSE